MSNQSLRSVDSLSLKGNLVMPGNQSTPNRMAIPNIQGRRAFQHSQKFSLLSQIRSRNSLFSGMRFELEENAFVRSFEEAVLTGDLSACEELLRRSSITMLLRLSSKLTQRISEDLKYFGYSAYIRFKTTHDAISGAKESIQIFICQQSWMVHLTAEISGSAISLRTAAGLYVSKPDGTNFVLTNNANLRLDPKSIFAHMSTIGNRQVQKLRIA